MCGQVYCGHTNATALSSSPVVSALGSKLDNLGYSPGQGKVLCPIDPKFSELKSYDIHGRPLIDSREYFLPSNFWTYIAKPVDKSSVAM